MKSASFSSRRKITHPVRRGEKVGRASRPSFLFHALTGETSIPLFGNTPKFLGNHGQRFYS